VSGFLGLITRDIRQDGTALLDNCMGLVTACCPDFTGAWQSGHADLRFALLKVTDDTFNEELPYTSDENLRIVGDVRLDRRLDLISQLAQHFTYLNSSFPDSTLVLHAYMLWGDNCVNRIAGDYSFAIWNEKDTRLFCARDHFGIIPFYYVHSEEGLLFTNFYRSLKEVPGLMTEVNEAVLKNYFFFGLDRSSSSTIYQKILKLSPAHTLSYHEGKLLVKCYWKAVMPSQPIRYKNTDEYVAHFTEIFERAVADRLRSPRIASQLSGGMDSSSVTAIAKNVLSEKYPSGFLLRACNIAYKRLVSENEGYFAALIARHLEIPLSKYMAEDYLGQLSLILDTWIAEPAGIPGASVEKAMIADAEAVCDIMLTGFGGDPLFVMHQGLWLNMLKRGHIGQFFKDIADYVSLHGKPPGMGIKRLLKKQLAGKKYTVSFPAWVNPDYIPAKATLEQAPLTDNIGMFTNTSWQSFFEMAHPGFNGQRLKVRFPFFCLELVEFLQCVPPHLLVNKYLLRRAAAPFLPREIVTRPKTPLYGGPQLNNLLSSGILPKLADAVRKESAFLADKVDLPALLALLDAPHTLSSKDHRMIISLINILAWRNQRDSSGS
jgi:asparagine synthase (glutamine-hydrolysing)